MRWSLLLVGVLLLAFTSAQDDNNSNDKSDIFGEKIEDKLVGSMMLTLDQMKLLMPAAADESISKRAVLSAKHNRTWDPKSIPYEISEKLIQHKQAKDAITAAIIEIQTKSCLKFQPRTSGGTVVIKGGKADKPGKAVIGGPYMKFIKNAGCWSYVGKAARKTKTGDHVPQDISLGEASCWNKRVALVNIMHALGFYYEHQRPDRNKYVEVKTENVLKGELYQFSIFSQIDSLGEVYDYKSIMHLRNNDYAKNKSNPTIIKKGDATFQLGQKTGEGHLTESDAKQLNLLYKCDMCYFNNGGCHADATCLNTNGVITCTCKAGYSKNGSVCVDINECAKANACHANAKCTNTAGSFTCTCKEGLKGDGQKCEDVNECLTANKCHANATCTNTAGSYTCKCHTSLKGDGIKCGVEKTPATVCEYRSKVIKCDKGKVIRISTAYYGRNNNITCPTRQSRYMKNTTCKSKSSERKVKDSCNGRNACRLRASNRVFGDPCRGTKKFLNVTYECVLKENRRMTVCQFRSRSIWCPMGNVIKVVTASYGRTDASTCAWRHRSKQNTTCVAKHTLQRVKDRCDKRRRCQVWASNRAFGDPCKGTYKYLAVSYTCVPGEITIQPWPRTRKTGWSRRTWSRRQRRTRSGRRIWSRRQRRTRSGRRSWGGRQRGTGRGRRSWSRRQRRTRGGRRSWSRRQRRTRRGRKTWGEHHHEESEEEEEE